MDVEKALKHMAWANSEYMRKIFCIVLCTLFILPSQSYSASASANDSCLSLNAEQYLEANSRLIPLDSNFTVEFDFYLDRDNKDYEEIISQGGQPSSFYIGINPDLGIRAGDAWIDTGAKMPLKKWVHIALTHTSSEVGTLYIDGKVFATINNYQLNNVGTATRVGAQYDAGANERITGCIDNLMIWKSVRTPSEVFQDSLVKSPITDPNFIAFYGFDSVGSTGLIEDNAVPSNSLRPLSTPEFIRNENVKAWDALQIEYVKAWDALQIEKDKREIIRVKDAPQKLIPYVPCFETNKAPCIESLRLISDLGKITEAIPTGPTYISSYSFGSESTPELNIYQWKTPGIIHENKTELLILEAFHFPLGMKYGRGYDVDETIIYIFASSMNAPQPAVHFPDLPSDLVCGSKSSPQLCERHWSINGDYKYEVTLRALSTFDFSHSNGEARDGNLTMKINKNGDKLLTFSGRPVTNSYIQVTELKPENPNQKAADVTYNYIGVFAHSALSGQSQWLSRCDYGRGMSLWYSGSLAGGPVYLPDESALTLQVESTHLNADKTPNVGIFNIVMPINLAKCLWGVDLSKAVSASISASYPELGISEVVTTSSRVVGDTFRVSAAGFHFSSPVIKLKLKQDASAPAIVPEAPTPLPSVVNTPVSSVTTPTQGVSTSVTRKVLTPKKSTIVCIKGNTKKTVTALNPKCPVGYKKK